MADLILAGVPVEGLFRLPTAPGLGLDIDEAALAQRRVELPGTDTVAKQYRHAG